MTTTRKAKTMDEEFKQRLTRLGLWGLLARWDELGDRPWLPELVDCEEAERQRRSFERRLRNAKLKRFKAMADFDWDWPTQIDREQIEELFDLSFIGEAANLVLVGSNGIGKTMIAKNLAHQALLAGHTARFITASELLNDLAAHNGGSALERRLRHYERPRILVLDELGYLPCANHHADLLFEVVSRRYHEKPIVLTTNKPFAEWNEVFPNTACVVALVDRLVHRAEIVNIEGESYRLHEAQQRAADRARQRAERRAKRSRPSAAQRSAATQRA
jgi:DNA replication protein DnaC